ncbi:response regulator [Ornithinimicrobium cryptoxanthini]|uniref:Response regulator transcription factor n=1 Tax=Ornithinimicrobium cryptoxanthini TaxID=2934161 RepID=A0ABY4YKX7_9MICO|nr:response regulator transcription factor [Ornithinimicrobium cryptoxanthini]USQ77269.1 response regulator transcription factor [Ornithinimicrobium cryptoxanthini]
MSVTGLTVVIVDDHPVFRQGLRALLGELNVDVVAEAADGAAAVELVLALRPDLVLMDLQMPGLGGVEATRRIIDKAPDTKVLVLTMVDDDHAVLAAVQAGALGYLLKGAGLDEIGRTLEAVSAGQGVYSAGVARRLRSLFTADSSVTTPFPSLTGRERDVLALIAEGMGNPDIARRLYLSDKTVRNYVSTIFTKLGVTTRAEAIVAAREAGLGTPGSR